MIKTHLTIAVAALGLLAAAPAANAVGLGLHGNAGAGGKVNAASLAGNANASIKSNANASSSSSYGTVVSVLASAKGTSIPSGISSTTDIEVVSLASLKGKASANAKALAQLTKKRASAIEKLDASVAANPQLSAKLGAAGYQASDVVAVKTDASGAVTLFVNG